QQRVTVDLRHRQAHLDEKSGQQRAIRVRKDASHQQRSGGRVERRCNILDRSLKRKPGLVRQRDVDPDFAQVCEGKPMLTQVLTNLQHLLFAKIGYYIDRIELSDLGQCRLLTAATDDITWIDQMLADNTVERRPNLGVAEVQLGQRYLRLSVE